MFSRKLLNWNQKHNKRNFAWKGIKDPYKIWVSEIILQQTRVEQGEKYYHAITGRYPDINELAKADETELYAIWQGLGYYNRCKNMLFTARYISEQLKGAFPTSYGEILKLKGIGSYTAAAISSFAYNHPHAVVDGNVVRVLSRYFGIKTNFHSPAGKKYFEILANQLLSKKNPALYNQAIMDLGATICKPKNPNCSECPFVKLCHAKKTNSIEQFPLKKEKINIKSRHFHFVCIEYQNFIFIQKRTGKDIWFHLHTPYSIESESAEYLAKHFNSGIPIPFPETYTQKLTHQKISGNFYKLKIEHPGQISTLDLLKVEKTELKKYAFPKMIISFFKNNNYL